MQNFGVLFDQTSTNGWVNNRDASDLRCYHPHYDATVKVRSHCVRPFWYQYPCQFPCPSQRSHSAVLFWWTVSFLSVSFILGAKILAFSCSGAHGKFSLQQVSDNSTIYSIFTDIVERFADPVLRDTLILICVVSKFTINVKIVEYIKD